MRGKKHRPEQIIRQLREADAMLAAGKTIGQVAQALGISEQPALSTLPGYDPIRMPLQQPFM